METSIGIPVRPQVVPCRFGCSDPAVGRYELSKGCACFPDDTEQALCVQHAISAEPHGSMMLVEIYDPERLAVLQALVSHST